VRDFVAAHKRVYVVEMNTDAQMCQLVRLHASDLASRVRPCNLCDGMPLTAEWITHTIMEQERSR
jgi:2-oxoglutarate/2-oxoacid ferredoxin oxidoreductase subunit alpha